MRILIAGAMAALALARPSAAQYNNPGVFISPTTSTVAQASQAVQITWTHDYDLAPSSRAIVLNGTSVTGNFSYTTQTGIADGSGVRALSNGTVSLSPGANTLGATICAPTGGCTTEQVTLTYVVPPPPAPRSAPVISIAPHHNGYTDQTRFGSTLSYTTPSYVSMGQERSVTLYYSSALANPRPFVQVDVTDHSQQPADQYSIRVLSNGAALPLSNGDTRVYFSNSGGTTGGTSRLGAELQAGQFGTGAFNLVVEVTSHWNNPVENHASTQAVRILVLNRYSSPYGPGWGVQGLPRIHVQSDGLLIDEGDGSARFFSANGGNHTAPDGDHSTITATPGIGYLRSYPGGGGAFFALDGRVQYTFSVVGDTTWYEHAGNVLYRIVDPAGHAVVFDLHNGVMLAGITTPGGRRSAFSYAGSDVYEIVEPDGTRAITQMVHPNQNRLVSWVDRAGGQWNLDYGVTGSLTVTGPQILVNGNQLHRPVTVTQTERRRLVAPPGQGTTSSPLPRVVADSAYVSVTDPRGFTTRTWLDRHDLPLRIADAAGRVTTIERDPQGQPVKVTDPAGRTVHLNWNSEGMLARTFDETRGLQTDYAYQALGGSTFLSGTSAGLANVEYDRGSRGEVLRVRMGTDTVARYTYDARLRVKTVTDRGGHGVEYFYDGNSWKNADSVRSVTSAGNQRAAFTYDGYGRTATTVDPAGRVTSNTYDLLNRLTKQRAPGDSVVYVHNALGLYRVIDALGKTYEFTRNALGWVTREADPQNRYTYYSYDAGGNVLTTTDRAGRTFSSQYDALARQTQFTNAEGQATLYGYDDPGPGWMWVRNAESADTLVYDAGGRLMHHYATMGGHRYEVNSDYNAQGARNSIVTLRGTFYAPVWRDSMAYGFDTRGRLGAISHLSAGTSILYNADGLPGSIGYPGTAGTITLGYTPRHRISSVQYSRPALHEAFGASSLAYDILDRLTVRSDPGASGRQREHAYDALGRLSGWEDRKLVTMPPPFWCTGEYATDPACVPTTGYGTMRQGTYGYDAVGNRTGVTYHDSTGAWITHGATLQTQSNRYATHAGWTLQYDSVGNLVRRSSGAQEYQYQWNSVGQLTGVYGSASGWVYYGYNGLGMRVRRTAGGVTTRYLYDGDDLAAELDANGNRIRTYTYWPGIDQPHSMRTWEGGQNGTVYYYALDLPTSTVRGLFNAAGTVTHRYDYGPYGEVQSASGWLANPLRFAARELDEAAGLYYVRARWYDPFLGRFISEDPIGLAGGINTYAYAANDPVNLSDPTGLCYKGGWVIIGYFDTGAEPCRPWYDGFFSSGLDERFSLLGGGSIFAGAKFGGWQDDGSRVDLGPGPYPPAPQCPNTTLLERYLARLADRRSDQSGTEEGYFVSRGQGPLRGVSSIGGRGVVKTSSSIGARPPFWAGTQVHNHPSGRGISETDSIYAYVYGIRVVSGSAKTDVFGAINPGGRRSTCVTSD